MAEDPSNRARKRYQTKTMQQARDELATKMKTEAADFDKTRKTQGLEAADRQQATKEASRSGDYDAKGNYSPFEPKRVGDD